MEMHMYTGKYSVHKQATRFCEVPQKGGEALGPQGSERVRDVQAFSSTMAATGTSRPYMNEYN